MSLVERASKRFSMAMPLLKEPETTSSAIFPDAVVESVLRALKDDGDMSTLLRAMRVSKQFARIGSSMLPTRPKAPSLPDEILLEIFSAVRFNSSSADPASDLASSLRVCQQWYRVGMPFLYQNFVMDVNYKIALATDQSSYSWSYFPAARDRYDFIPSARFYDTATKLWSQPWTDSGIGAWIYSLSVEMHFWESAINQPNKHSITAIIILLPNIRTFSVRAAPLRQQNYIQRAKFMDLIVNMPSQIVNFELDLQSRDSGFEESTVKGCGLCSALAKLLPQLQTLRLRLSVMCTNLLTELATTREPVSLCPDLRVLSISLYTREFDMSKSCCERLINQVNPLSPSILFINALQKRIDERTLFPNLRKCSLVCLRTDMAPPNTMQERIICKNWNAKMRTWSMQKYFPCAEAFNQPWYVRTDVDGVEVDSPITGLTDMDFSIYRIPENLKIKHSKTTDLLFEGEAGWVEDAFGARYPPGA
jgi:hypothetical protein